MLAKSSVLLLTTSVLLLLPGVVGVAGAEIDVQTRSSRTIIDDEGRIFVQSGRSARKDWDAEDYYDSDKYRYEYSPSKCYTNRRTYRSNRAGSYGNNVVHTQTSTTVCR